MNTDTNPTDHFQADKELKRFVRNFLKERTDSLRKDVKYCLTGEYAPFPAILYCFSTIDLLGALNAGHGKSYRGDGKKIILSEQSIEYMNDFMDYTKDQGMLVMKLFRHKLVHLAQPHPVLKYNGKNIRWVYHHHDPHVHLWLETLSSPLYLPIKSGWAIRIDQYFHFSISRFMEDIVDSVYRHGGFLHDIETSDNKQELVKNALNELYDINQ